ncbi:MAG: serine/threonine protein kinase [Gemmatimonadetes bacterium]|nr:serine/threonine protein kinase [Gemmatimonadota bacterium]
MTPTSTESDSLFLDFQEGLAGRYSIDRELGRGGMGIVYLAREVHLDRLVAIKLLPPALAARAELRDRFLREARLAAKLTHPNIIPIHAVEESGAFVFYVMAFVEGETLAERVRTRGPVSSAEAVRILREAAWALAFAHAQGFVHRDIKPDNILIESATGRALVADFGIAAAIGDAIDERIVGTPEFMSPEQVLGGPLDARSDLYALGATAFFALSGRLPFEGANPTEVLARQVSQPPRPLASLGVAVPRKLAALVDRCLAKDPALRGALLLPASVYASATLGGSWGVWTLVAGAMLLPITYLSAAARRLAKLGFAHQDLQPAFAAELERSREELQIANAGARATPAERLLAGVASVAALTFALAWAPPLLGGGVGATAMGHTIFLSFATSVLAGLGWLALVQRRRDVDTAFWSKVWTGPVGKALFGLGRRTLGRAAPANAVTHRATELSLGLAGGELFESLPRATRDALGDVPRVLQRLQEDAQALRTKHNAVARVLDEAGEAAAGQGYAEVRATGTPLHARLGDVVSDGNDPPAVAAASRRVRHHPVGDDPYRDRARGIGAGVAPHRRSWRG